MTEVKIKGTIPSFTDKSNVIKLFIELDDNTLSLDALKELLDKELVITLNDPQTNLNEFAEEEETGGEGNDVN